MQLGHLVPEASILLDHGSLGQVFWFVSENLLPDVMTGVDVSHHVVENRLFRSAVCPEQLMIFFELGLHGGNA